MDLEGKTVLVTGAGSGLGRACALLAAREGANLALGDISGEGLETTLGEVESAGGSAVSRVADVRRPEECAALADLAVRSFGRLDGAVCSAGVDRIVPSLEMTLEEWERVIGVNLTGTFLSVQASVRAMLPNPSGGSIITFASGIAVRGRAGGAHYAASKGGIVALTKSFALEFGPRRIRVNAVAPGATATPMLRAVTSPEFVENRSRQIPMGRIGQPQDIAAVVGFLLSDASGWMTGQTLHANGGSTMP